MRKKRKKKNTAFGRKQYLSVKQQFDKLMNEHLQKKRESITVNFDAGVKNMHTKKFVFRDGVLDKTHEVELCKEPIVYACFTEDFARMIQLFRNITDYMDFSQPFRAVVEYDPEGLRTVIQFYETKEALQQHSEQVRGKVKD